MSRGKLMWRCALRAFVTLHQNKFQKAVGVVLKVKAMNISNIERLVSSPASYSQIWRIFINIIVVVVHFYVPPANITSVPTATVQLFQYISQAGYPH
jgi:hypothetical protein